jgi:tetratricopeptide (TPR) repeat protein
MSMLRRIRSLALWAPIALALITAHGMAHAQAPAPTQQQKDEARGRFDRGITLVNEGDNAGALAEFKRAYQLIPNPVILYNIGLVYAAMGRAVDAADTLGKVLDAPGNLSAAKLERARTVHAEQAARIGELRLDITLPGVVVEVDNVRVGVTPLKGPLRVAGGTRLVTAVAQGHIPFRKEVTVAGGQKLDVHVELVPSERSLAHLAVKTRLPGAEVVVDGQVVGRTPLPATLAVPAGTRRVEVRRRGYTTARSDVTLAEGSEGQVTLEPQEDPSALASEGGTLVLRVSETEPIVSVDGKPRPNFSAGIRIARGPHVLKVERGGFVATERTVHVEAGAHTIVSVNLVPTPETRDAYVSSARAQRTWGWVATLGGAVIAGGSAGYLAYNAGKVSDAQAAWDEIVWESEPGSKRRCDQQTVTDETCVIELDERDQDLKDAKGRNTYGYVGVGVGVAIAATGAILLMTAEDPERYEAKGGTEIASSLHMMPAAWVAPESSGFGVWGRF